MAQCGLTEQQLMELADEIAGTKQALVSVVKSKFGDDVALSVFFDHVGDKLETGKEHIDFKMLKEFIDGKLDDKAKPVYQFSYKKMIVFVRELSDYVERCMFCGLFGPEGDMSYHPHEEAERHGCKAFKCYDCERHYLETGSYPEPKIVDDSDEELSQ